MSVHERRQRLRRILAEDTTALVPAPVYDPVSARLAEDIGFELGLMAGSAVSLVVLGDPDLTLITLSELAEQVRRVSRASEIPLIVDADHGYGNALNVRRTVRELEDAGAAAIIVEDTWLPEPYGAQTPQHITVEEGVDKMRAAVDARSDPSLALMARINLTPGVTLDEVIARARAYEETGVDTLFFGNLTTRAQVAAIAAATRITLTLGVIGDELNDGNFLARNRVRFALQGQAPLLVATKATHDALLALREQRSPKNPTGMPSSEFMSEVRRDADHQRRAADFLGRGTSEFLRRR